MAPALTKLSTDNHGIHLATSLNPSNMNADGGATLNTECDPQLKTEDSYAQWSWLHRSLPFMDTCISSKRPLDFSDMLLSSLMQDLTGQYKTFLLSSPSSLLSLLSFKKQLNPYLVACPGAQDIHNVPELSSERLTWQQHHQQCQLSGHQPDSCDIPQSPSKHYPGALTFRYSSAVVPHQDVRQGDWGSFPTDTSPAQLWTRGAEHQDPVEPVTAVVEEAVREQTCWHLSQHDTLLERAGQIQRRLQALLGEHVVRHCSHQLGGLKEKQGKESLEGLLPPADTKPLDFTSMLQRRTGTLSNGTLELAPLKASLFPPSKEIQEFACYAQVLLQGMHDAVDSDATESSSGEELEPKHKWGSTYHPVRRGCEWRWQKERAEVGSRWTWLQLHVAELEGHIQRLGELYRQITSSKGGVILAESQPLTDWQIQQALLTEIARDPPSDTENEPSSPTRLLRNIEIQSAQLSQIVSSLMPPLNLSPSSSPISKHSWRQKRAFNGGLVLGGFDCSQKESKRRVNRRRRQLLQMDATCVSARTRPLVTYHKPRLFINTTPSRHRQQDPASPASLCSTCASCDPMALCSDPTCSSSSTLTSRTRAHPVLSLTSDTPLSHHFQNSVVFREDWVHQTLPTTKTKYSSDRYCCRSMRRAPPTRFIRSHNHKSRRKERTLDVSLVRWAGSARTLQKRANRRGRKRKQTHSTSDDEEDVLSQLSDPDENMEHGVTRQTSHICKPGPIRRRQGESVYNIDNIVIPMSLAAPNKVENPQYKDIITPSWRVLKSPPLEEQEMPEEDEEQLCDKTFSLRHLGCEKREKLGCSSRDKMKRLRRTIRSGGRKPDCSDGAGGSVWADMCAVRRDSRDDRSSRDDSRVDWGCSHPNTDGSLEECVPQLPWDKRVFPLYNDEEKALMCHEEDQEGPHWVERQTSIDESVSTDTSSSSIQSHITMARSSAQSLFSTTLPPAGYNENNSLTADLR
ncbi:hypothetical protein DPEC_G00047950 [Dallia pectoralis]|uniref:Uncharacterized protein n=1 Tax=Dallia pectoralis TaxID=75939 RepID=A0ACC2HB46_DALPE|nr:hypothetical protein DPEC_G00047950 [Dallia pectoralis]